MHVLRRAAAAAASASALAMATQASGCVSKPDGLRSQRQKDFKLSEHYHGKTRVRVLRVQHDAQGRDTVQEFSVQTRLFGSLYSKVFTHEDNNDLVATDTQKNTCYVIAKRSSATSPEGYGVDVASHLMSEYPMLDAVEVEVTEDLWRRTACAGGGEHDHGFVREGPEQATAFVRVTREQLDKPEVRSGLQGLTVLKTTQSGFAKYLKDSYTLLPETGERCMATQMKVEWTYTGGRKPVDYAAVRSELRSQLMRGFFGPSKGGVYSASLQATIYDAGCLVLQAVPAVQAISIYTPNMHMIPFHPLKQLGGEKASPFADDVYVSTSDPAGTIYCTVSR